MQLSLPEISTKPNFAEAFARVEAWFSGAVLDRPPVRFKPHNCKFNSVAKHARQWGSLKERWFDAEYQIDSYLQSIEGCTFHGETFPVFWPNLGPEVYSAFFGAELTYQEVTSYSVPMVREWSDIQKIRFDENNPYLRKIEEMTALALEKCAGRCLVGYTDLHPGMDCVAAWRDPQELCMDLIDSPEEVRELIKLANRNFQQVYDRFDATLKAAGQLSVAWMQIPSRGKMHIPSCDFSSLISKEHFEEFCLPIIREEVRPMTHNVFHVDGKGVAKHIDRLLEIPEIHAIQWVQGAGSDLPIMQWVPLLKCIRAAGKPILVDLTLSELEDFIGAMPREGLFLCIDGEESMQPEILRRIERW